MKKVMIAIGNAGGGHIACANAVKDALLKRDSSLDVLIVDIFELSKFSKNYDTFYYLISRYRIFEILFNLSYWLIDRSKIISKLVIFFSTQSLYKPTLEFLREEKPDMVICNNGVVVRVIGKCREDLEFKYVVTVPDLISVSRWWADRNADLIFCPLSETVENLKKFCKECRYTAGYYPLKEVKEYSDQEVVKLKRKFFSRYSFKMDTPTILITGCGFATREIIKNLEKFVKESNYQFLVLVGRDEGLKEDLLRTFKGSKNIVIEGYTTEILDLFAISDLIIAKPGPATLLEIEKIGRKAIFTRPVGYQEWGNVEYLLKNPNFVYVGSKFKLIPNEIEKLLSREIEYHKPVIKDSDALVEYLYSRSNLVES
ncbi:MAG: MGDG synthase family glycosyltransferase [Candidatus Dojkabacteria bacterium]